jgi:hypothetical protein
MQLAMGYTTFYHCLYYETDMYSLKSRGDQVQYFCPN